MFHRILIVGSLDRDPELRRMPNGTSVAHLALSTTSTFTNGRGEEVENTVRFRVSVFGKQAAACKEYLSKGRHVLVEGRLTPDPKTGHPRLFVRNDRTMDANYELAATTVRFLGDEERDNESEPEHDDTIPVSGLNGDIGAEATGAAS